MSKPARRISGPACQLPMEPLVRMLSTSPRTIVVIASSVIAIVVTMSIAAAIVAAPVTTLPAIDLVDPCPGQRIVESVRRVPVPVTKAVFAP